jgi:hypothetical protein
MTGNRPFNNPATNEDKADYLREQRKLRKDEASSYYQQAIIDLGLENSTGRFTSKPDVTGTKASAQYPRQPEGSPWAGDPVGVEPPLNYSINDLEPTGEAHEQALSELALSDRVRSASAGEDNAAPLDVSDNRASSPTLQTGSAGLQSDTSSPLVGGGSLTPTAVAQHLASAPKSFETLPSTNPKPLKRRKL